MLIERREAIVREIESTRAELNQQRRFREAISDVLDLVIGNNNA